MARQLPPSRDDVSAALASAHRGASVLPVRPQWRDTACVHLLWESVDADEALATAAALRAAGDEEQARDVIATTLDQVVGLGGVPQPEQRSRDGRVVASNRPPLEPRRR